MSSYPLVLPHQKDVAYLSLLHSCYLFFVPSVSVPAFSLPVLFPEFPSYHPVSVSVLLPLSALTYYLRLLSFCFVRFSVPSLYRHIRLANFLSKRHKGTTLYFFFSSKPLLCFVILSAIWHTYFIASLFSGSR